MLCSLSLLILQYVCTYYYVVVCVLQENLSGSYKWTFYLVQSVSLRQKHPDKVQVGNIWGCCNITRRGFINVCVGGSGGPAGAEEFLRGFGFPDFRPPSLISIGSESGRPPGPKKFYVTYSLFLTSYYYYLLRKRRERGLLDLLNK